MNIKQTLITFASALGALLIVTTITFALPSSTLEPQGESGENTQYTLNDIYTRLTTNEAATEGSGLFTTPEGTPESSFYTLKDIYNAIPTIDPTKVAVGTTYLGVDGELTTELEWSEQAPASLCWDANQGCAEENLLNGEGAFEYCANLPTNGGGWRLPKIGELLNGIAGQYIESPATHFGFGYFISYWSGTELGGNAWAAFWDEGIYFNNNTKISTSFVRCVR